MSQQLLFGPFALDPGNATLLRDGRRVDLAPKAFDLLVLLARRPNQLVTKDEILDEVWGRRFVSESVVKTVVSEIRGALGDEARAPRWLETVARRGYRFLGDTAGAAVAPLTISPLTTAPQEHGASPMIGRTTALESLATAWSQAAVGRRQIVFVTGEPGIGKTMLINQFARQVDGAMLAFGQCIEQFGSTEPYLPVLEAINAVCRDDPAAIATLRQVAPTWLVQMPWHLGEADRAALQREVTGAGQDRMLREMGMLLEQFTARGPLLLVLEDLHWSDPSTVQLLGHLARRRSSARLMVLATFRLTEVLAMEHPVAGLRQELRLHKLCEEITLDGLNGEEIGEFCAARFAGARADPALISALERHTDGLPLFLGNVLDELVEQGAVRRQADGAWQLNGTAHRRLPLPENLLGLAEKQMARQPADVLRLLEAAALSSTEFDHLTLAEAMRMDAQRVRDCLDGLARRRLWLRSGEAHTLPDGRVTVGYTFLHALFRHAFAIRTGAGTRIELHRRLGLALEALHGARANEIAGELAQHAEEGSDPQRAGRWYAVAAQMAMQRLVPLEALALADRGLALLRKIAAPAPAVELQLLATRINALMATEGYSVKALLPSIERATALIDQQPLSPFTVPLWHAIWWTLNNGGEWDRCKQLAARLAQRAELESSAPARAAALNLLTIIALYTDHYPEAIALAERGLAVQDGFDEADRQVTFIHELRVELWAMLCVAYDACGRFADSAGVRAAIEERIRAGLDPLSQIMGLWFLSCSAHLRNDVAAMLDVGERAMQLMSLRSALPGAGPHRVSRGWARVMSGDSGGVEEARLGIEHYTSQGSQMGILCQRAVQAEACLKAGELAAAEEAIAIALAQGEATEFCFLRAYAYRVRGALRLARGEGIDAALVEWQRALALAHQAGAPLQELTVATVMSRALRDAGRAEETDRLREILGRVGQSECPAVSEAIALLAARD